MAQGSGGVGSPSFSQVEGSLRNVALQFASIVSLQQQLLAGVNAWRQLERELALASAAAGGSAAEFARMEKSAREFSLTTSYSAAQVANAFYSLASAGLSVQETLAAASGVVLLAQASLTDLGEASDVVSSAMSQFGLEAAESARVSNLFVAATNSSLATVPKLAYALRQVGPIAAQMGLSIEGTVAALDTLFDAGLRGEQAGTALRNTIARIVSPVGDGAKAMQALGVSTYDAQGRMRDFADVMKELAGLDLSVSEVVSIVGIEAASGAIALMEEYKKVTEDGTSAQDAHQKEITNTNAAYQQAVRQLNTLDGSINRATNNFNDMRITLGQEMVPMINWAADALEELNHTLQNTDKESKLNALSNGIYAASFLPILFGLSRMDGAITGAVANATKFRAGITTITSTTGGFGAAIAGVTKGVGQMASAVVGLAGTALGLGALVAVFVMLRNAADEAAEAANKARQETVAANLLNAEANEEGLTGRAREELTTDVVSADDLYKQRQNIAGQTGEDAFGAARATVELLSNAEKQFEIQNHRIESLRDQAEKNIDSFNETARNITEMYNTTDWARLDFSGSSNVANSAEGQLVHTVEQVGGKAPAADAAEEIYRANIAAMDATAENAAEKRQQYYIRILQIIDKYGEQLGLSEAEQADMIEKANKRNSDMAKQTTEAQAIALREFGKAAQVGSRFLSQNPEGRRDWANSGGLTIMEAFRNSLDNAATNVEHNLSETSIRSYLSNQEAEAGRINELMERVRNDDLPKIQERLSVSVLEFIKSTQDVSGEDAEKLTQLMNTPEARAASDEVAAAMVSSNLSQREGMEKWVEIMKRGKIENIELFDKLVVPVMALALIDERKAELALSKANLELQNTLVKLAKLNNDPGAFAAATAAVQSQGEIGQDTLYFDFFEELSSSTDDKGKAIVNFLTTDAAARQSFAAAIERFAATGETDAIDEALAAIATGDASFRDTKGLRYIVERLGVNTRNNDAETMLELTRLNKERREDKEEMLLKFLELGNSEDMAITSQRLTNQARFAISEFYAFPVQAIDKAIADADVDARANRRSLVTKFEGVFNELSLNVDGLRANLDMRQAFSGDDVAKILGEGSGDVFGTVLTAEALRTTEGMQTYVDTVISEFTKVVGDTDEADLRIATARNAVTGMLNEFVAMEQSIQEQFRVLSLQRQKTIAETNNASKLFELETVQGYLDDLMRLSGLDPTMQLDIEVALQAEVTRVQLDSEKAKQQINKDFMEQLGRLELPYQITPDGKIVGYDATNDPIATRIQELFEMGNAAVVDAQSAPIGTMTDPMFVSVTNFPGGEGAYQAGGFSGGTAGEIFAAMIQQESRGRQFDANGRPLTSSAGAIGVAQVMPGTAREAARYAGVEYDEYKYRNDAEYNAKLGEAYFVHLTQMFEGNERAAVAAYNAGPGRVEREMRDHADQWEAHLPQETKDYLRIVFSNVARGRANIVDPSVTAQTGGLYGNGPRMPASQLLLPSQRTAFTPDQARATTGMGDRPQGVQGQETYRNAINVDVPVATVQAPEDVSAQYTEEQRAAFAMIDAVITERHRVREELEQREAEFLTNSQNAELIGIDMLMQAREEAWDKFEGSNNERLERMRKREADLAHLRYETSLDNAANPDIASEVALPALKEATIGREVADNNAELQERISLMERTFALARAELSARATVATSQDEEAAINRELNDLREEEIASIDAARDANDRLNASLEHNVEIRRQVLADYSAAMEVRANQSEEQGVEDALLGARAALADFAAEVPTLFETSSQVVGVALNGISNSMVALFTQGTAGVKAAVASMLMSMAQLIIKMLAMYAVMQLIRAIPGGTALLAAMDMGAAGAGAAGTGFAGGGIGGGFVEGAPAMPGNPLDVMFPAKAHARGGMHGADNAIIQMGGSTAIAPIFTNAQRAKGGIRPPNDPAISVFGEGDHPEAYIPMIDRRTIPMMFNDDGTAYVPLPSGGRIPVSIKGRKFAKGGTSHSTMPINLSATRNAVAVADQSTGAHMNNTPIRNETHSTMVTLSPTITLNGSATKDDADMLSAEMIAQMMAFLDARDNEKNRERMRNRGDLYEQAGVRS